MDKLPINFKELGALSQFILYKLVPAQRLGKTDKIPIDYRTGQSVDPQDAGAWLDCESAINAAHLYGETYGVGFVLTENDPFFCIDVDNCISEKNEWSPIAVELLTQFAGAGIEISQSRRGIHIFGRMTKNLKHSSKNELLGIEFYTEKRFIALTGIQPAGDVSLQCDHQVAMLVQKYFKPNLPAEVPVEWRDSPVDEWNGPTDDDELIEMMLRSKSARAMLGTGASIQSLWHADAEQLSKFYSDSRSCGYNQSDADLALAQHLAFWTGNHSERIERLMWRSALAREKWQRPDYLRARTIPLATSRTNKFLNKKSFKQTMPMPSVERPVPGILNAVQQMDLFKGCTYVIDDHAILTPSGMLLEQARFRVEYGGYTFILDASNGKTTRNAFEAFTESQVCRHPRANSTCFKPNLAAGQIVNCDGQIFVNTWVPLNTPRRIGDISLFINHLEKILPVKHDREILLSYLAALVQHQGIKFKWCPIIQGVEGNGKTILTDCIEFAIGTRYCVRPLAQKITEKFNDWLYGSIFAGIEDIYLSGDRGEVLDILKPMITSKRYEIEPKYRSKRTVEVCCNFLINTNYQDALRKTHNDRRFAPFFTAQQDKEDLIRDGMNARYFSKLMNWLENQHGFEIVSEFLHNYEIPDELNPALGNIAPITSSTQSALEYGLSIVEELINEAVQSELLGFRGGWISSTHLDHLLNKYGRGKTGYNKRYEFLKNLGYKKHPGLSEGRSNTIIPIDGIKSRLYIKNKHPAQNLQNAREIVDEYVKAQSIV